MPVPCRGTKENIIGEKNYGNVCESKLLRQFGKFRVEKVVQHLLKSQFQNPDSSRIRYL
jgi:hypothetical protein